MSSDSDQDLDQFTDYDYDVKTTPHRKLSVDFIDHTDHFGVTDIVRSATDILSYAQDKDADDLPDQKNGTGEREIVMKHIRISAKDFDPVS